MGPVFVRALARNHQRRLRLAFALVLLYVAKKLLGPSLTAMLVRWHLARAGETPRLIYRKTPANNKLLSHCATMILPATESVQWTSADDQVRTG
ncbi:hypothetical protein GN244_ATG18653 [Phytophthora infestans]|uniref:Uncharacterized protein n=1 Tax=Phytophthora infestans TaxID=4787 RepID=A0A833SKV1_PHYIN|nr:hypothetical protein GN244_ATG18653 [Phytophthora infestans]KAF4138913.1 hypothetical protein GN958_ATG11870 [Phytophthora infestans]